MIPRGGADVETPFVSAGRDVGNMRDGNRICDSCECHRTYHEAVCHSARCFFDGPAPIPRARQYCVAGRWRLLDAEVFGLVLTCSGGDTQWASMRALAEIVHPGRALRALRAQSRRVGFVSRAHNPCVNPGRCVRTGMAKVVHPARHFRHQWLAPHSY